MHDSDACLSTDPKIPFDRLYKRIKTTLEKGFNSIWHMYPDSRDDYFQETIIVLIEKCQSFKKTNGEPPSDTYILSLIKKVIPDAIAKVNHPRVSRDYHNRYTKIRGFIEEEQFLGNHYLTNEELAKKTGFSILEIKNVLERAVFFTQFHENIEDQVLWTEPVLPEFETLHQIKRQDIRCYKKEVDRLSWNRLATDNNGRLRMTILKCDELGRSGKEIGKLLGITANYVKQHRRRAKYEAKQFSERFMEYPGGIIEMSISRRYFEHMADGSKNREKVVAIPYTYKEAYGESRKSKNGRELDRERPSTKKTKVRNSWVNKVIRKFSPKNSREDPWKEKRERREFFRKILVQNYFSLLSFNFHYYQYYPCPMERAQYSYSPTIRFHKIVIEKNCRIEHGLCRDSFFDIPMQRYPAYNFAIELPF